VPYLNNGPGGGFEVNPGDDESVRDAGEQDCDEQQGNPIVFSTGNKIETFLDFSSSGEMPLHLRRTYNHYWHYVGIFGRHWVTNFDYSVVPQGGNLRWAQRPDGRRIKFIFNASNQRFEEDKATPIAYIQDLPGGGYRHVTEALFEETYNSLGFVTSIVNRQGIGWTFAYDSNRLQSVTHTSGRAIQFQWTVDGNGFYLSRVTDPDGQHYNYSYDLNRFGSIQHRLKRATLPGSPNTDIDYVYENNDFAGALTGVKYNGVRYSTFQYDAQGRATLSRHLGNDDQFTFAYSGAVTSPINPPDDPPPPGCVPSSGVCPIPQAPDPSDDAIVLAERQTDTDEALAVLRQSFVATTVVETNPLQRQTTYRFEDGELVEIDGAATTHCAASFAQRSYDANGHPQLFEDFNGNQTQFQHNSRGQLLSMTEGHGDPVARTTNITWDTANNRPTQIEVPGDHRRTYVWGADHRLQSATVRNLSANGVVNEQQTTSYTYVVHANGMLNTVAVNGPISGTGDVVTYTYDTSGNLLSVGNSLGHVVSYSLHNGRGQPGRMVGINGEVTEYSYDARGRLSNLRTFRNGAAQNTAYSYNAEGLLSSVAHPDGQTESFTYDLVRRLTSHQWQEPQGQAERKWTYDDASNPITEQVWRTVSGQATKIFESFTDYDELSRVRAVRGNNGQITTYGYDTNNNLTSVEATLGQETTLEYDALNRLRKQTDALLGQTLISYDLGDRVVSVTDPRSKVTSYKYDGFGQLRTLVSPDTGTTTQQWDAQGLRTTASRADGGTLAYGYDALGRQTSVIATIGNVSQGYATRWDSSDPNATVPCTHGKGRVCTVTDVHQQLNLGYTPYGELAAQSPVINGQGALTHSYDYDQMGRLQAIHYPDNIRVDYGRNKGYVTSMSLSINNVVQPVVTNVELGVLAQSPNALSTREITYGDNQHRQEYWDVDGRFIGITGKAIQGLNYTYDPNNRITSVTNFYDGALSQTYGYDDLDRLTSVASSGLGSQAISLDPNGNRTQHTRSGVVDTYSVHPANNRLTAIAGGINRAYTYRSTGQVQTISGSLRQQDPGLIFASSFEPVPKSTPSQTFTYDPFNRLSGITSSEFGTAIYQIAGTGMRAAKTVNGQATHFVYGPSAQLYYERNMSSGQTTHHLYLHGQPIGMVRRGELYYVLPDHLDRPEMLTDDSGTQVVWRARLAAFDRHVAIDQIGGYHLGFPGQYHDQESGFAYN
ncbi:MAG: RHS repeat protein, partial [Xanthomonadales bacterium]|nr:RHS repeat protein [Xanthomonadales bacterium]